MDADQHAPGQPVWRTRIEQILYVSGLGLALAAGGWHLRTATLLEQAWPEWLVALFWLSVMASLLTVLPRLASGQRAAATVVGLVALQHASFVGVPLLRGAPSASELRSLLTGGLSSTQFESLQLPLPALLALFGALASGLVIRAVFEFLLPNALPGRRVLAILGTSVYVAIGVGVVFLYATGSAWPWSL